MKKVLCTTSSFGVSAPQALERLVEAGFEPVVNPFGRKLTEDELIALLGEYRPVGLLAGTEPVTSACLEQARDYLQVVSRVGVGWDNVDHDCARLLNIPVLRTAGVLDQSVAELAIGMILSAFRNIALQDREMRAGVWKKRMGSILSGKVAGIIGFGAIGQKLGKLLSAFGVKVIYHDVCVQCADWAEYVELSELLKQADVISLHASCAQLILGRDELQATKQGVVIVNTARGELVDEDVLVELLQSGHIGYACLDVFAREPYTGPLLDCDNAICSPHIGSYAHEARVEMEEMAVENLLTELCKGSD